MRSALDRLSGVRGPRSLPAPLTLPALPVPQEEQDTIGTTRPVALPVGRRGGNPKAQSKSR